MQSELCSFHLNTSDISTTGDVYNQYGSINTYRTDMTWNNVSLKTIMGPIMYNNYDKFNIKLCSIMHSEPTLIPSSTSINLNLLINIDGLPFSNSTYYTKADSNLATCELGSFLLTASATQIYYLDDNIFTIEKPSDRNNIRIFFTTITGIPPIWTNIGPQYDFYFRIYGVKK
jgi:hypothetical protein